MLPIVGVVTEPALIEAILRRLRLWPPPLRPPKLPRARTAAMPEPAPENRRLFDLDEEGVSQVPAWWDDDEAYSSGPPSQED